MNELIVVLIDKIKDDALRGAIFRLYNNLVAAVSGVLVTFVGVAVIDFSTNGFPENFSDLADLARWETILVATLVALLKAAYDKYVREKTVVQSFPDTEGK